MQHKIINIQFLRAIAAMMVVLFHTYPYLANQESWLMPIAYFFMQVGYAGVDVFFVISGYVMWISTQRSTTVPVGRFAYNRLTRIYLGYWPYFLIFLLLVHTYLPNRLENVDLMGSFWLTQIGINKLLIQIAWTLTYELYFYAWFAVLLLLPRRWLLPAIVGLFGLVVLIQGYHILVNDIYSIEQFPYIPFYLTFMTSPFCLEFLAGCLIGSYFQHHRLKNLFFWIVAGLLVFLAGFYYQKTQLLPDGMMSQGYFLPQRVLFWGTTSAIMVAVLVELNMRGVSIWKSGSQLLGGASYSIYLSHIPILFLFKQLGVFQWMTGSEFGVAGMFALIISSVLLYSVLHYLLIEQPVLKLAKRCWNFWSKPAKVSQQT